MIRYLCPLCRTTILEDSGDVAFERRDDGSLRLETPFGVAAARHEAVLEEHFRSVHSMTPAEALKVLGWREDVGRAIDGALR